MHIVLGGGAALSSPPAAPVPAAPSLDALSVAPSLPFGGGGFADDLEWWKECRTSLVEGKIGTVDLQRLPGIYLPKKAVMYKADYTRNAVAAAWADYTRSVPGLASLRPHFTLLETALDLELEAWDKYAGLPHVDKCHYDGTDACDIHSLRVERPLGEAQRADPAARTGHPKLTRAPYDLQMYSQTLEHLYDLPLAAQRMFALAAPGGFVFVSVPFWNIPHMRPSHQQGVSPCGMYGLLAGAGFSIVRLGWYGHANFSDFLARPGSHWPNYLELGFPEPFSAIPAGTSTGGGGGAAAHAADAANTVWVLAQRPEVPPLALSHPDARGDGALPPPPTVHLDAATRPRLAFNQMFLCLDPDDGLLINSRPSSSTLLHLLNRFPAWLNADIANVVLAAVFQERLLPHAASSPLSIAGRTAHACAQELLTPALVKSWSAASLGAALSASRRGGAPHHPAKPQARRMGAVEGAKARGIHDGGLLLPSAGFLSDLFEGFRDPLDTLRAFALTVIPGSPLLLACRPGDAAFASRPTLGTCTTDGFLQLLCRAGLTPHVKNYGAWGRIAYTRAALVEGHFISFRTYFSRIAGGKIFAEEGEEAAQEVGAAKNNNAKFSAALEKAGTLGEIVDAGGTAMAGAIEALAEHVIGDFAGEAAFSWAGVVFAIVEGWSLPLVPHYATDNGTVWHTP